MRRAWAVLLVCLAFCAAAHGQAPLGPPTPGELEPGGLVELPSLSLDTRPDELNPIMLLDSASRLMPGAAEQDSESRLSTALNIMVLLTVIALVPSIMLMTTCFVRIMIVLALLKQAMGTQSLPPPQVLLGLAMFMTILIMAPTLDRIHEEAIVPFRNGEIQDYGTLWDSAKQPLRDFMFDQIEATGQWSGLYMILRYRGIDTSKPEELTRADVDMVSLVPAFMLSELKTAFMMGFRVYLPFLVIDMVIASVLISMSMMMLPPVLISLPFKLLLFVLVDGWQLVISSLLTSFVQDGDSPRSSAEVAVSLVGPDGANVALLGHTARMVVG